MAYQQIILHVGLSKTGSTSIQANCSRHASVLESVGIRYPKFEFEDCAFPNHAIPVALAFSDNPSQYAMGIRRLLGERVNAATIYCKETFQAMLEAAGDTLVLSSERIAGFKEADLANIRKLLSSHAGRLHVVVYVRSPFELLESTLQERAKAGAVVEPLAIPGRAKARYQNLHRVFSSALEVVNFHEARVAPGGLVGDFLSRCGLSPTWQADLDFSVDNQRISMEAYLLMDAVNRKFLKGREGEHGVARQQGDLQLLESLPGEKFRFAWEAEPVVFQAALEEYRWFESELGLSFPAPPESAGSDLWGSDSREALGSILADIDSAPLREFLTAYLDRVTRQTRH